MLLVGLRALTPYESGIDDVRNDLCKALSIWAYDEATETIRVSFL